MTWRAATNAIMSVSASVMGEPVALTRLGVPLAVTPLTLRAIFERATNFDETGVDGYADLENFKGMADFRRGDLLSKPERGDMVFVPASNETFLIFQVIDDGFARYRCLLEDV